MDRKGSSAPFGNRVARRHRAFIPHAGIRQEFEHSRGNHYGVKLSLTKSMVLAALLLERMAKFMMPLTSMVMFVGSPT